MRNFLNPKELILYSCPISFIWELKSYQAHIFKIVPLWADGRMVYSLSVIFFLYHKYQKIVDFFKAVPYQFSSPFITDDFILLVFGAWVSLGKLIDYVFDVCAPLIELIWRVKCNLDIHIISRNPSIWYRHHTLVSTLDWEERKRKFVKYMWSPEFLVKASL